MLNCNLYNIKYKIRRLSHHRGEFFIYFFHFFFSLKGKNRNGTEMPQCHSHLLPIMSSSLELNNPLLEKSTLNAFLSFINKAVFFDVATIYMYIKREIIFFISISLITVIKRRTWFDEKYVFLFVIFFNTELSFFYPLDIIERIANVLFFASIIVHLPSSCFSLNICHLSLENRFSFFLTVFFLFSYSFFLFSYT